MEEKYEGITVNPVKAEMGEYVAQKAQEGESFGAVVTSYAAHHLLRKVRQQLMQDAFAILINGGIFLRADPVLAMSFINKMYFNFTDEGTFASFDNAQTCVEDLTNAGFKGIDMLGNPEYQSRLKRLLGWDTTICSIDDYIQNRGYAIIGIKD